MDNTLQNYSNNSLMAELGSWNQQENKFRDLFSDHALQDREFLKMKLSEYNRIWYKHRETAGTTDERALMVMLQFHRRKLQKTLYPGLLTRLVVRAFAFTRALILQSVKPAAVRPRENYNLSAIPVPQRNNNRTGDTKGTNGHKQSNVRERQQYQHQGQRARKNHHRHKAKGRSV